MIEERQQALRPELSSGRRAEEFSGVRPAIVVRSLDELGPERLLALLDHRGAPGMPTSAG